MITMLYLYLTLALIIGIATASYLQMPLVRRPQRSSKFNFTSIKCHSLNSTDDNEYKEICFQKDITYSIPFIKDNAHYSLAADFTIPLSWIKGKQCQIDGTIKKCNRVTETIAERIRDREKKSSRLHKMALETEQENSIIQGSSEIIRGEFQKQKSVSLIVKDSNRLNNFFELILLGLFIYGERDNLTLINTNFIEAMYISANLNDLSDGAISLRFDETAENSFLQEIFTYVQAVEKTVSISLGNSTNNITIGDLTAKYTRQGYSGIQWIDMPSDEGYGKLTEIIDVGIGDLADDREEEVQQTFQAAFTLSASYISFPEQVINKSIIKLLEKQAVCKVNSYNFVECSTTFHKKLEKLMAKNLIVGFKGSNMIIPLRKLVLKVDHGKRVIFNIKQSFNHWAILGEPIFEHYVMFFDYLKNRVGFSQKREETQEFLLEVVTLVRFLCSTMVLGCCFICCFQPCQRLLKKFRRTKRSWERGERQRRGESQFGSITGQKSTSLSDEIERKEEATDFGFQEF